VLVERDLDLRAIGEPDFHLVGGAVVPDLGRGHLATAGVGERGGDGAIVGLTGQRMLVAIRRQRGATSHRRGDPDRGNHRTSDHAGPSCDLHANSRFQIPGFHSDRG